MDNFRTLILPAAVAALARRIANTLSPAADGMWTTGLSPTGAPPATHLVSSGYWFDTELDFIVNTVLWPRTVLFGDPQVALADLGLQPVVEPPLE